MKRNRAAEAVSRFVKDEDEQGQLLSFLSELTEEEFSKFFIRDDARDGVVVGFLRRAKVRHESSESRTRSSTISDVAAGGTSRPWPAPVSRTKPSTSADVAAAGSPWQVQRLPSQLEQYRLLPSPFSLLPSNGNSSSSATSALVYMVVCADGSTVLENGLPLFFVDTMGAKATLEDWLDTLEKCYRPPGSPLNTGAGPPVFFVNAFVKGGKTHLLKVVLPAVLHDHKTFGKGKADQFHFCFLDTSRITGQGLCSYKEGLANLLSRLMDWAAAEGIMVPPLVFDPAAATEGQLEGVIETCLCNVSKPVMLLFDEIHTWFFMEAEHGGCNRAKVFMKNLMCYLPPWVAVAATGSSMCCFWVNVAEMPPNGVTLALHHRRLDLPSSSQEGVDLAWGILQKHQPLPEDLKLLSPPTPSMLVYLASEWLLEGEPPDIKAFVVVHEETKILSEVATDFCRVLKLIPTEMRTTLLALSAGGIGHADFAHRGFRLWLEPLLQESRPGHWVLASEYHCTIIKLFVDSMGNLTTPSLVVSSLFPMVVLPAQGDLLKFSNTLVQQQDNGNWHPPLRRFLEECADRIEGNIEDKDWFQYVFTHKANSIGSAAWFTKHRLELEKWEIVAQYFRFVRNILGHEVYGKTDYLDVLKGFPFATSILAIPRVLKAAMEATADSTCPVPISSAGTSVGGTASSLALQPHNLSLHHAPAPAVCCLQTVNTRKMIPVLQWRQQCVPAKGCSLNLRRVRSVMVTRGQVLGQRF